MCVYCTVHSRSKVPTQFPVKCSISTDENYTDVSVQLSSSSLLPSRLDWLFLAMSRSWQWRLIYPEFTIIQSILFKRKSNVEKSVRFSLVYYSFVCDAFLIGLSKSQLSNPFFTFFLLSNLPAFFRISLKCSATKVALVVQVHQLGNNQMIQSWNKYHRILIVLALYEVIKLLCVSQDWTSYPPQRLPSSGLVFRKKCKFLYYLVM